MTAAIYDNDHFNQPKPYVDTVTLDPMELIEHSAEMKRLSNTFWRAYNQAVNRDITPKETWKPTDTNKLGAVRIGWSDGALVEKRIPSGKHHALCICVACWTVKVLVHRSRQTPIRMAESLPEHQHAQPDSPKGKNGNIKVFYHNQWREVDIDKWGYCTFYLPEADTDYGHTKWTHLDDRKGIE